MAQQSLFGNAVIAGSTSYSDLFLLRSSSTNLEVTGKVYSDFTVYYTRAGAAAVLVSAATQTAAGAWSSGGIAEIDATHSPGLYRFDVPDAAVIAGADSVVITLKCTGCYLASIRLPLGLEPGLTRRGTAAGYAAQAITLESGAPHATDEWKGALIWIESATTGSGQAAVCTTSSTANPPVLTLDRAWPVTLTGTATYRAYKNSLSATTQETVNALWDEARSSHTTSGTFGEGAASVQGNVTGSAGSVTGAVGSVTGNISGTLASLVGNAGPKKNTAISNFTFLMTDATTHLAKTGLTITAQRSIDGGSFASCSNSAAEIGTTGRYKINLSAADMNGNVVYLLFTSATADDRDIFIVTGP